MLYFVSQVNTCFQKKMGLLKRNSGLNLIIIDLTINKNIALLHMGLVLVSSNPLLPMQFPSFQVCWFPRIGHSDFTLFSPAEELLQTSS